MRHVRFALLSFIALCVASPIALIAGMPECQLHRDPAAAEACFRSAQGDSVIFLATLGIGLAVAIGLHIARSKWVSLGLVMLALGPWVTILL